jgi:hypothetical protein
MRLAGQGFVAGDKCRGSAAGSENAPQVVTVNAKGAGLGADLREPASRFFFYRRCVVDYHGNRYKGMIHIRLTVQQEENTKNI